MVFRDLPHEPLEACTLEHRIEGRFWREKGQIVPLAYPEAPKERAISGFFILRLC